MESSGRSRLRHVLPLLVAMPFVLVGLLPAPATASDEGAPAPTSIGGAEQGDSSGQGPSAASEPVEADGASSSEESTSSEGSGSTESSSTEGSSSPTASGQSGAGPGAPETSDDPEGEEPAPGEPVVESERSTTAPGATGPKPAPSQAPLARRSSAARAQEKVTICHRTNSRTNPYNQIAVSVDSIIKNNGHATHTGPIFAPDVDDWGDIIPPILPEFPSGLNWPEGRAILDNGCEVQPDVGPQPTATIGQVVCVGDDPSVEVTLTNRANATQPAFFRILVNGVPVETVGPVPPGQSRTVTLTADPGGGLEGQEDTTITVDVRSGGEVITSEVLTVDCDNQPPPDVVIEASLDCVGDAAIGTVTVTNQGQEAVTVTAEVNGGPVGTPLEVPAGETGTASADLSVFEDQTITVAVLVDGVEVATYTVTPDCVAPRAEPGVSVAGQECPPPSTTVTLANTGDPDSQVVFVILVDGEVVQRTAPLFGGDITTIVGDLSRFEDQTVVVELRANREVLGSRTIRVNCQPDVAPGSGSGSSAQPGSDIGTGVLPGVGAGFGLSMVALGLGLVAVGSLFIGAATRRSGSRRA